MMPYPDWKTYEALYAKYIYQRDPKELFSIALDIPNGHRRPVQCLRDLRVMDIAAGTGRLTADALDEGAKYIVAVDKSEQMLKPENLGVAKLVELDRNPEARADYFAGDIEWFLDICGKNYDLAFCQQAVNYWISPPCVDGLADAMKPGGVFVFTTFNNKPPVVPMVKEYFFQGRHYVEVSQLVTDSQTGVEWVHHVQVAEGFVPHTTQFRWIAPDAFDRMLSERFNVYRIRDKKTDIYRCVRQ